VLASSAVQHIAVLLTSLALLCAAVSPASAAGKAALQLKLDSSEAVRGGATGLEVGVQIASGWHINAHQPNDPFLIATDLTFTLPPGVSTGTTRYPEPQLKSFAFAPGKKLLVHDGDIVIRSTVNVPADFVGSRIRIAASLRYQACNDSTCSPPSSAIAELLIPVSGVAPGASVASPPGTTAANTLDIGRWLEERGLVVTLLLVLLLGLGLNLTPCVYPLISVTLAYFGTRGGYSTGHIVIRALTYLLGITVSFSIVGVVASLSGGIFGAALQKPAVLAALAVMMIVLALGSFGVYQLRPPQWLMQLASASTHGAFGAFFLGLTMGVVAAPCIGPVVVGLLIFVGSRQSVLLGFELFFALGLGMGLPYVVLAMAAGSIKSLPRSGEWLVWVERLFGFLLLGLAGYFLTPLLPRSVGRLVLPVLLAVAGVYLGFVDRSGRGWPRFRALQHVVGLAAVILAIWGAAPPRAQSTIRWERFAPAAVAAARAASLPSVVDFVADWCIPCHEMDATTFVDPEVQLEAERFVMLRADMTTESEATTALTDQFQIQGVPTIVFLDAAGNEVDRLVGYVGADKVVERMRRIRTQSLRQDVERAA
jgi:thiol:disulfide interchange protein DsbD